MRKHFFLFVVLAAAVLSLAACREDSANLRKLDGKWLCDVNATMQMNKGTFDYQFEEQFTEAVMGSFYMEFDTKTGKMTVGMAGRSESGDFTVVSDKDEIVVLKANNREWSVELKDDDTIVIPSGKSSMVLKRSK